MSPDGLEQSLAKMRADGAAQVALDAFARYYERAAAGETGTIDEPDIEPATDLPAFDELPEVGDDEAARVLERAVVIKLNGGLGTSMGMTGPKSLVEVKDGLTFLDVIARQVLALRERFGVQLPLVLMDSFRTRDESLAALDRYPELVRDAEVPLDFLQGRVPKLRAGDLTPVEWPADPELEWAPPGHGDLYTSIVTSGTLATLLERGYRYAFVSNADNLGAVLDTRILAWFAREELPFAMEVAERLDPDRKGGHLARRRSGGLVLREIAQVRDEDREAFGDIARHPFFNTNSLWVDLAVLDETLRARGGVLELPMIVNRKTADPGDAASPEVLQLETAMGAAIGVFDGAAALHVPRRRFAPVKTTNDLLALRSDAYTLTDEAHVELVPQRGDRPPLVDLDPPYFRLLRDFEARFAEGPPSLVECVRLRVRGDVAFGRGVVVRGEAVVEHGGHGQRRIEDGAVLEGS